MNKILVLLLAAIGTFAVSAQDTNSLKTDIGVFEARTSVVIVKGYGPIGSGGVRGGGISGRLKETTDVSIGQKTHGLAIQITGNPFPRERILVDDNEIDALLSGLNYLIKINYDVTTLPGFEASYTTKAGLRVIANSVRREGTVQTFLQFDDQPRIALSSVQIKQFYGLIAEARKNLDALKTAQ